MSISKGNSTYSSSLSRYVAHSPTFVCTYRMSFNAACGERTSARVARTHDINNGPRSQLSLPRCKRTSYEKRFRWNTNSSGSFHKSIFLNACTCSLHPGQYLPLRTKRTVRSGSVLYRTGNGCSTCCTHRTHASKNRATVCHSPRVHFAELFARGKLLQAVAEVERRRSLLRITINCSIAATGFGPFRRLDDTLIQHSTAQRRRSFMGDHEGWVPMQCVQPQSRTKQFGHPTWSKSSLCSKNSFRFHTTWTIACGTHTGRYRKYQ